ncbi:MAG: carbonic anhydrase [Phycisphaerae bacterium]|nr:carbonic anhydrase [Phycisphaerae bacterium]
MPHRTSTSSYSTVLARRIGLAALVACSALTAVSLAGDPHAPPSKPEKPAASPPKAPATGGKTTKPATKAPASEAAKHEGAGSHGNEDHASKETAETQDSHAAPTKAAPATDANKSDTHDAHDAAEPAKPTSGQEQSAHGHSDSQASVSPDESLRRLIEGNARFAHNMDDLTKRDVQRRAELAGGQHPFAIILSCADSRVPPELVFDQELGDLFVVRVAGNTADDASLGSIEYAVDHLGSKLIVVMGHSKCGAVKAAVDTSSAGKQASDLPGHLPEVVSSIMPAVAETKSAQGDPVRAAVIRNVQRTVLALQKCGPVLAEAVSNKGVRVVGAIYDLETGEVDLLPELSPSTATPARTAEVGPSTSEHVEH